MISAAKVTVRGARAVLTLSPNKAEVPSTKSVDLRFAGINGIAEVGEVLTSRGVPMLSVRTVEDRTETLEPVVLREDVEYDFTVDVPLSESDIGIARRSNSMFPFAAEKLKKVISFNSRDAWTQGEGRCRITGRLNFRGFAGKADLSLEDELGLELVVDVSSTKIGYEDDFRALLEDLAEIHAGLILTIDGATETLLRADSARSASYQMQIFHLRRLFRADGLAQALAAILSDPSSRNDRTNQVELLPFVTDPDLTGIPAELTACRWHSGGPLARIFRGFTPERLPNFALQKSYDTPENRFVKASLIRLQSMVLKLSGDLPSKYAAAGASLKRWAEDLEFALQHPLWRSVSSESASPNSMILQRKRGYREFLNHMLVLEIGLKLNGSFRDFDSTAGDLEEVHGLYEIWCYFQLRRAIEKALGVEGTPPLAYALNDDRFSVSLYRGTNSAVQFAATIGGKAVLVEFFYNRKFSTLTDDSSAWDESYSFKLNPDFSVRIQYDGRSNWVHFDAKYRVVLVATPGGGTTQRYKSDDIHVMHGYRDALLGTRGSFVLYPGPVTPPDIFVRNPDRSYRAQFSGPSVGAFALSPADSEAGVRELTTFLRRLVTTIAESPGYTEEAGFYEPRKDDSG